MANDRRAVFFDLQGTLGGSAYGDITSFAFFDNAKEALRIIQDCGYLLFIITNQSRIAKGIISHDDFDHSADRLISELRESGISVEKVFCCPHRKEDGCSCRKPKPYFPKIAAEEYGLNLSECIFIGDIYHSDVEMARNVGSKAYLVMTGAGHASLEEMKLSPYERVVLTENILSAAHEIEKEVRHEKKY